MSTNPDGIIRCRTTNIIYLPLGSKRMIEMLSVWAGRVLCFLGRHERDKNYLFVVKVTGTMKRTLFCRRPGCKHELPHKPVKPGE